MHTRKIKINSRCVGYFKHLVEDKIVRLKPRILEHQNKINKIINGEMCLYLKCVCFTMS